MAQEICVLTNLCMVYDNNRILVQDRLNPDWPGITFPGGHVEPRESFADSVIREVKEETGLDISDIRLCGVKQFTMNDGSFRYIVLLYKTNSFSGELVSSSEGRVFWVDRDRLSEFTLADGFLSLLEVFDNETLTENYIWNDGGRWQTVNK